MSELVFSRFSADSELESRIWMAGAFVVLMVKRSLGKDTCPEQVTDPSWNCTP